MKEIVSLSGGRSSAYVAANYSYDHLLFALVRTEDKKCEFPDKKLRQVVSDKIGKEFVGTLEDDLIIYTMLDLEQYLGHKINWVSGITFDEVVKSKGGWLPNKLHRYCTTHMKIEPMFYWWAEHIRKPAKMKIGYRANEWKRVERMKKRLNQNGLLEYKATFEKHSGGRHDGLNKWELVEWQMPSYPMVDDGILVSDVHNYWKNKPVRFAKYNNCTGCFHRNPAFLKSMMDVHPNKLQWFIDTEKEQPGTWRSDVSYQQVKDYNFTMELDFDSHCDEGGCGL